MMILYLPVIIVNLLKSTREALSRSSRWEVLVVFPNLFVELFCDTFGPDQSEYLFLQYPFTDIYGNRRSIDIALESEDLKIGIEIDGETYLIKERPKR